MIWDDHRTIAGGLRDQACADLLAAQFLLRSRVFTINGRETNFAHVVLAKSQQACEKLLKGYFLFNDRGFDPTAGHRPMTDTTELSDYQRQRWRDFFTLINRGNNQTVAELKWIESLAPHRPQPVIRDNPAPLAALPADVEIPELYRGRVRYDSGAAVLIVSDRITASERQEFLALSSDPSWDAAVNEACTDANSKSGSPQPLRIIPENTEYPFWSDSIRMLVIPAQGFDPRRHGIRAMKATRGLFQTLSRSDPRQFTSPLAPFLEKYSFSSELDDFPPDK